MATAAAPAKAKTVPNLTIKPSGKGYLIAEGKREALVVLQGNVPHEWLTETMGFIRKAVNAYTNK